MEKDSRQWDDYAPDPESVEVCRYYCDDAMQYVRAGVKDESILYPATLEIHAENIVVIE